MAKKKDFKKAAGAEAVTAMQFLDTEEPEVEETKQEPDTPPKGYKINPKYIEVKSKRVQLVFRPSLYERLRAEAKRQGTSMNDLLHVILDKALPEV